MKRSPVVPHKFTSFLGAFVLVLAFAVPALAGESQAAQEARWKELNAQVVALYQQGKYAEAAASAHEALRVAEATFGPEDARTATSLNNLAFLYDKQGRYAVAEPLYRRALAIREKTLGPEHPDVAQSLNNLAALYCAQGRYAEAEPVYKRALAIDEKALGPEHPDLGTDLNNLAELYRAQGRYAEAEPVFRRALAIWEKALGPDHPDVATALNNLAQLYDSQGKYAEAEPLYRRSLAIVEKALGPEHRYVATSLNNLALLYYAQGKYAEAEPLYRRALAIREKALGSEHPDVAQSLNNLAELYRVQGKYAEAEPLYRRALALYEKALGPDHPDVANSLNNLAGLYYAQGKYAEAKPLFERSLAIQEKALGPDHPDVATALNNLAQLYDEQGKYAEAEPLYRRALAIREKAQGPEHPHVATALNNLAVLYREQGKFAEAEPLYRRALAIREKALGPEHADVAQSLNNLAELYRVQGKYPEAGPLYRRALAIWEKALGPDHPDVATALNNLAGLYRAQGKYAEAEPLYRRALAIREKALGPEHPDVATALNNLAVLYREQGKYAEAEPLYRRSLAILEKALGPGHPDVASSLNNLAVLYEAQGKYAEAEPLCRRALAIVEKALGAAHPGVAESLNNLAELYREQGKYAEAEPLYRRALAIDEKALGPDHPDLARDLSNLALLYKEQGKHAEAEPLFRRALAIWEKALGPDHPIVATSLMNLAVLYSAEGKFVEAQPLFDRGLQNLSTQFEQQFAYMSEKERLGFLDMLSGNFPGYLSFCFTYRDQSPGLAGKMYDLLLWEKGLIASSVAALRAKVAVSGDKEALALLEKLTAKKTRLAALANAPLANGEQGRKSVEQLRQEANELERELVKRSSALAEEKQLARVTWREVQKALKPAEAAIEIVRLHFHDGKKWTDTYYYVALVVTPETTTAPKLVLLGEASKLEGDPLAAYQQHVGLASAAARARGGRRVVTEKPAAAPAVGSFYQAFWKPLEAALGGAKRVYLSPDGVLNQVSLGVVPAADGRLLLESYDLRIVSSTKDLLRQPGKPSSNTAVLVGNPDFGLDETTYRAALKSVQRTEVAALRTTPGAAIARSAELRGGSLNPLPGTQVEVEAVSSVLTKQRWNIEVFTQQNALEETVKRVRNPRVLHVATHGFFEADQERKSQERAAGAERERPTSLEDPMLRSGLYFAGADRARAGKTAAEDLDDGVLTAYEATQLNLQGTELVVLSACETGLGETSAGEGVFGLRRALQVAGAEAVLMSMWAVPDKETQELMTLFYQKWLGGEDKHQALREAQLEMRERVKKRYGEDRPRLWGAFVLVGR